MCATSCDSVLTTYDDKQQGEITGPTLVRPDTLIGLCTKIKPEQGIEALLAAVNGLMPDLQFAHVLTRGGWHRFGGVVDGDYRRIAANIVHWVEQKSHGDLEELIAAYGDAGYFATRLSGKTHFLTAARSDAPQDFVQIEIEELRETLDRPLIDRDWFPDSVEEFLDPLDYPHLEPEPVAPAYYQFRRITSIADLLRRGGAGRQMSNLRRFFQDWADSSAANCATFCHHWALALRESRGQDGLPQISAKPVSTFAGVMPALPADRPVRGAALANAIHGYDRHVGYPFAWYFTMLAQKAANVALADAVLADQMGAYDYLSARDLKVLRDWECRPYAV